MKLAAVLIFVGAGLFGFAIAMPSYKDEKVFMERYMSMSVGQSREYWALRDEMLTSRFRLQDYGVTLVLIGLGIALTFRSRQPQIFAPASRTALIGLAIAAPFLTVAGYVFDLFLGFHRGEFPHWADSIGIPLMGIPIQLLLLLLWAAAHLIFLRGAYRPEAPLAFAVSLQANPWLLVISAVTMIVAILSAVFGQYYYAIGSDLVVFLSILRSGTSFCNGT